MKKNNNNEEFYICISKYLKNKNILKKVNINLSLLSDYESILQKIYEVYNENIGKVQEEVNKRNLMEIYLYHPIIKDYTIYNKDEWNFYYNYNVINECILNNKLKIDYKVIKNLDNINKDIKSKNGKKVIEYIMGKIPAKFYIKILFSFFNEYKDIGELFKNYCINELIKSNLSENEKFDTNKIIKTGKHNNNNRTIYDTNKYINNKYLIKTEEFLNLLLLRCNKTLDKINKIINDNLEEKIEVKNDIEKSEFPNHTYFSEGNIQKKTIFESSNSNLDEYKFLSDFNIDKEKNIYFDEKQFLKKLNKEEYYYGFEKFKDRLNKELSNII